MKIGIITDSSANLSKHQLDKMKHVKMLPLLISVDGTYFRDQIEIDSQTVYEKMPKHNVLTSLPHNEDYIDMIESFKKDGYTDLLIITLSANLSGTFNSLRNANEAVQGINIHMYDTKTLSMALGYMVIEAAKLIEKKKDIQEIFTQLDDLRYNNKLFAAFTLETLKWLKKGGRIGKVEATIGELLHLKPIIGVDDTGVYQTLAKGFGMKRALLALRKELKKQFEDQEIEITIHYGDNLDHAKAVEEKLMKEFNVKTITLTPLTPVLGVHVGPEIIAVIAKVV